MNWNDEDVVPYSFNYFYKIDYYLLNYGDFMKNFSNYKSENKKEKINFSEKKDYCVKSLVEVNSFLCNLKKAKIALCLFKWFK